LENKEVVEKIPVTTVYVKKWPSPQYDILLLQL